MVTPHIVLKNGEPMNHLYLFTKPGDSVLYGKLNGKEYVISNPEAFCDFDLENFDCFIKGDEVNLLEPGDLVKWEGTYETGVSESQGIYSIRLLPKEQPLNSLTEGKQFCTEKSTGRRIKVTALKKEWLDGVYLDNGKFVCKGYDFVEFDKTEGREPGPWISVKDRWPKDYERVLLYDIRDSYPNSVNVGYCVSSQTQPDFISHWMPLPPNLGVVPQMESESQEEIRKERDQLRRDLEQEVKDWQKVRDFIMDSDDEEAGYIPVIVLHRLKELQELKRVIKRKGD